MFFGKCESCSQHELTFLSSFFVYFDKLVLRWSFEILLLHFSCRLCHRISLSFQQHSQYFNFQLDEKLYQNRTMKFTYIFVAVWTFCSISHAHLHFTHFRSSFSWRNHIYFYRLSNVWECECVRVLNARNKHTLTATNTRYEIETIFGRSVECLGKAERSLSHRIIQKQILTIAAVEAETSKASAKNDKCLPHRQTWRRQSTRQKTMGNAMSEKQHCTHTTKTWFSLCN